jgi:nitrate reductase gamma subunit
MKILYSFAAITALILGGAMASQFAWSRAAIAIVFPYAALAVFTIGFAYRVVRWALAPVPFRIPTTCGQQKSLPWIKPARLDNPSSFPGVVGRMLLEVLLFRSLFRNSKVELQSGRLIAGEDKYLWLGALAFHWSLLMILLRHLRLVVEPVPAFILWLQRADGFFQVGVPEIYISDVVILGALGYLLLRRLRNPLVRYISLFTDYFALLLLLSIAVSGVLMRYLTRVDVVAIKQFALSLAAFTPALPQSAGAMFYIHLLLVSALAAYLSHSKVMHMGGVLLSPTRNLANNNRMQRHVNPWNYPVKTHTYAEWEQEFRDKLVAAGLPVEAEHARTASAD